MNLGLQDRNVLVTGSTSGIGKAIARAYLAEGARVVLHGLTQPEADGALAELAAQDGRPLQEIVADYFRREEPTSLIQRFIEPDEVARLVVFLSAQTAMNGGAYRVEGGIIRSIL